MSSWIKLIDQSFNKVENRNNRSRRMHHDTVVPANIEDDSSQDNCDLNLLSSTKKRKVKHLDIFAIENEMDSSDECFNLEEADTLSTTAHSLSIDGRNTFKVKPMERITNQNEVSSSDNRCDSEYNSTSIHIFSNGTGNEIRTKLPSLASIPRQSSTSRRRYFKKRRVRPLEHITIENEGDSSDGCSDVGYDPDGAQLPNAGSRSSAPMLPLIASTTDSRQPSTSHSISTTEFHPWSTISKSINETISSFEIEDSLSDSNESSTRTLIEESSDDSSLVQSPVLQQQESMIETQESITPPVAPFIASNTEKPKKRKVRMKKGGMVEQLKKSMSQAKSNLLFWQHHRSAELISPGAIVTVNRVEKTYGRVLIHTKVDGEETIFSLCSSSLHVNEGDIIEVNFDIVRSHKTDTHVLYSYVDKVLLIKKNGLR